MTWRFLRLPFAGRRFNAETFLPFRGNAKSEYLQPIWTDYFFILIACFYSYVSFIIPLLHVLFVKLNLKLLYVLFLNLTGKDLLPYSKSVEISSQQMFNLSLINFWNKKVSEKELSWNWSRNIVFAVHHLYHLVCHGAFTVVWFGNDLLNANHNVQWF